MGARLTTPFSYQLWVQETRGLCKTVANSTQKRALAPAYTKFAVYC